ncbi:type II toxin-antitoxin system VapC family toxin [Desulfonatronum sp. SC1]|uniref:type II toxin-antitoxin system VapC family toxin n=1 Tax=Desulfonatronum sp. SC1 TaxID=2109626 RepID=UPI000D305138|nr:type II toxin-antitoxin system VapC family toxin [Desulfonatronum sp. SC1]PTN32020.1 PIN domain nuclease [Desulfonatronum sp. SC1]
MTARFLLDTHIVLWWLAGHRRLSVSACKRIAEATCFVSVASIWEVAIKFKLGKLHVAPRLLLASVREARMIELPVSADHAASTVDLPLLHNDPFDRLLIAQARYEEITLLTADEHVGAYGDPVFMLS